MDHAVQVAERTFADLDWEWFDQFYLAHDGSEHATERAGLLEAMQAIFLDELVHHIVALKGGSHG